METKKNNCIQNSNMYQSKVYSWIWNSLVNPDSVQLQEALDAGEDAQHLESLLLHDLFKMFFGCFQF